MKRLILTAIAAAGFSAAVSAREYNPGSAKTPDQPALQAYAAIETADQNRLALETVEKLTPDTSAEAPRVTFAIKSVDPLGYALSAADGAALKDIATWQVQILDSGGKKVGFIQGRGQPPPPALSWAGLSENGDPFPSGFYTARFVWMDNGKKVYATQKVSFNLFTRLAIPKFAELKLSLPFSADLSLL